MKDHQNDKGHQAPKTNLDNQKEEKTPLSRLNQKEEKGGLHQDHPEKHAFSIQNKKISDTPSKSEDTEVKGKTPLAGTWPKTEVTQVPKGK